MPSISRAVNPASVWFGRITSRSASTWNPKVSVTCQNISRCCPVATTVQRKSSELRSAATTGASLIASGRVPMKITTFLGPLTGRGSPQATAEDLPRRHPDELGVGGEVALPHLAWLHQQPPRPLQARRAGSSGGARRTWPASTSKLPPTPMITGTSSRSRWRSQKTSLKGDGIPTKRKSGRRGADLLDDAPRDRRRRSSRSASRPPGARATPRRSARPAPGPPPPSHRGSRPTDRRGAPASSSRAIRSTPVTRSGTGVPAAAERPDHRHSVGQDQVAGAAGLRGARGRAASCTARRRWR